MKKTTLALFGAAIALLLASCSRNHTCICEYNVNDTLRTMEQTDIRGSKNHALHECCTIRKTQLETAGNKAVLCAVPI